MGEHFLRTNKQETAKVVRSFVLHTSKQIESSPQSEPPTTSRSQDPLSVASDRLPILGRHCSPKDTRVSPPLSPGDLCRRDGTSPRCTGRAGEEGPVQHLIISNSFMECWQTLHRLAGPPFPADGTSACFTPLQPLPGTGRCATYRWVGGVTEDP